MSTVKVNWSVPVEEWDRFRNFVEFKHGKIKGHIGREAERAMREYAEFDEYAGVEDLVDRLVQAAGRSAGGAKRNNNSLDVGADGPSTRARCRVSKDVKERFASHVDQTDLRLGIAFAHALQIRREGGRAERLEDKLERVVEDAESLLKIENDSAEAGESMGKKERQTVQICNQIQQQYVPDGIEGYPNEFPRVWIEQIIEDMFAERSGNVENYYIPEYLEEVKERLGYVTKPGAPKILVNDELVDPTPAYETKEYDQLNKTERVEAVNVHLGRQARENGGLRQQSVQSIREHLFENQPRKETVKNYVREAGSVAGFSVRQKHGKLRLMCDLEEVTDEELLEYIQNGEAAVVDDGQQKIDQENGDSSRIWDQIDKARTDGGGNNEVNHG